MEKSDIELQHCHAACAELREKIAKLSAERDSLLEAAFVEVGGFQYKLGAGSYAMYKHRSGEWRESANLTNVKLIELMEGAKPYKPNNQRSHVARFRLLPF